MRMAALRRSRQSNKSAFCPMTLVLVFSSDFKKKECRGRGTRRQQGGYCSFLRRHQRTQELQYGATRDGTEAQKALSRGNLACKAQWRLRLRLFVSLLQE